MMVFAAQQRQVMVLAAAQALFQTASVLVMTVGGLAGGRLASDPSFATAPIAAMFLGTALATIPASRFMARRGRRVGFMFGAGLGVLGGVAAAIGLWLGSLTVLCVGTALIGAYQGFAQFYRFAASEVSDAAFRPRAIALVLAGGVVAALLGPELGRLGALLLEAAYAGSFLILALVSAVAIAVLAALRVPAAAPTAVGEPARPLAAILRQPTYLVALFGAATGYGVMILAMTATPLAMVHHHHDATAATRVIQLHVLGMFLPSFFTGALVARFGVLAVMLTGIVLLAIHVVATFTGAGMPSFAFALVFLGVGWNFLYVGGTTLLTSGYRPAERAIAQSFNDMTIFIVGLASSLGAGALLRLFGWQTLNLVLLPWLALAGLAIVWLALSRRDPELADAPAGR